MRYCGLILTFWIAAVSSAEDWPGWRGPRGDGTSLETNVPTAWNGPSGQNILWKTRIPGSGYSSPIVSKDVIFLTAFDHDTSERTLHCLDRSSGSIRWTRAVVTSPLEGMHALNSAASGTPAADGEHVFVTFFRTDDQTATKGAPGEMVVAAYDYQGNQQWLVAAGEFSSVHGFCSCPVLYNDLLIINGDHDGESYIAALRKDNGELAWKTPRVHQTRSYSTPLLRPVDGKTQAVLTGSKRVAGFDPDTGELVWWIEGPTEQFVASMVFDNKYFYLNAGFPTYHVMAVRPGGKNDVTDSHVQWHVTKSQSYVPSPVVTNGLLFVADDRGIGHCYDAETGEHLWRERLGRHFSASLVTANKLVYFTADTGITKVMKAARTAEIVQTNELGESVFASPAISNGRIYLRGKQHLYCVAE